MAEILSIDPDARLEAVRRQLAQYHRQRVALVLPDDWDELDNAARIRLLQRQAQIQRCELALVTRDERTRKAAQQVGLPVFARAEEASGKRWRMTPRLPLVDLRQPAAGLPEPPPWRQGDIVGKMARPTRHQARQRRIHEEERYRRTLPLWLRMVGYTFIGIIMVGVISGFALYILPAATLTLTPGSTPVDATVQLTANPDVDAPDLEVNLLPGRLLEATLELTGTISTSGVSQRATDWATGTVTFLNTGATPVTIPVGTVVSTGTGTPVSFQTTDPAELPGGVGAQTNVTVKALEPGTTGNVRANTINIVEGALRFRISVINQRNTAGGGSQLATIVTQQDRDTLLAQLEAETQARALATLQQKLEPGEWLPPETLKTFIIAQAFSAFNDEETPELDLTLRTLLQGVAVNEETTRAAMLIALQRAIPEGAKLVTDSFSMERIAGTTALDRSVQFTVALHADYVAPIDPAEVRAAVAGLTPADASVLLRTRWNIARNPEIYLDPPWLGILPRISRRIQVRVDYGGVEVAP